MTTVAQYIRMSQAERDEWARTTPHAEQLQLEEAMLQEAGITVVDPKSAVRMDEAMRLAIRTLENRR